jgi:hypothetical protein
VFGAQGATGNAGATGLTGAQGATGPTGPSDIRLKKNIEPIESALENLIKIRGVEFYYNWDDKEKLGHKNIGFIAQEVLPYFPELVFGSEETNYTMKYKEMIAVCIEALKEQEVIINSIEDRAQKLVVMAKEKRLL